MGKLTFVSTSGASGVGVSGTDGSGRQRGNGSASRNWGAVMDPKVVESIAIEELEMEEIWL